MPEPVISLLSALLFIVVPVTVLKVESPARNVDEFAVPDPNLAVGTVPDAKSDASKLVKLAPLIAGSAPVNFDAVTADNAESGMFVKDAPDPEKVVAVQELAIEILLVILAIPAIETVSPVDGNILLTFKLLDIIR